MSRRTASLRVMSALAANARLQSLSTHPATVYSRWLWRVTSL
jgi:hypothetical protein